MPFPSLRHSWLPAIFLVGASVNLVVNGPLFFRTAGVLGTLDLLLGFLLAAPLLLAGVWLVRVGWSVAEGSGRRRFWAALACASLLSAAVLVPLGRTVLAARELRSMGFWPNLVSSGRPWVSWLAEREIHLAPVRWNWPTSYLEPPPTYPTGLASLDRVFRLLAICRTLDLTCKVSPNLGLPPSVALLRDLRWLTLRGRLNEANTDVLGQLPQLRELLIDHCGPRNLRTLGQASRLRRLRIGHLESPEGELEGFSGCPHLETLEISGTSFRSFQAMGLHPNLRTLILGGASITDFSALATLAPKLESLTITQTSPLANLQILGRLSSLRELHVGHLDYALPTHRVPEMPHLRHLSLWFPQNLSNFEPLAAVVPHLEVLVLVGSHPPIQGAGLDALTKLKTFHAGEDTLDPATFRAEMFRRIPEVQLPAALHQQLLPERLGAGAQVAPPSKP